MTEAYDPRSGLHVAEQAHVAGAVLPPAELGNQTVTIEFVVRGSMEEAHRIADIVSLHLMEDDRVTFPIVRTVTER